MKDLRMRLRREDGVSAVIVAISLVAILGAAVLSIDSGSVWKTRRDLITDTDAAAEAAAIWMSQRNTIDCTGASAGAQAEAVSILEQNDPATSLDADGFEVEPYLGVNCRAGTVTVPAFNFAKLAFAGIFGFGNARVFSSSTAQWGLIVGIKGKLWPIGICDQTSHYIEWATIGQTDPTAYNLLPTVDPTDHPTYPGAGVVHHFEFQKEQNALCGDSPGNWDHLDYDGSAGGANDLKERWEKGYQGEVWLDDALTPGVNEWDCNEDDDGQAGPNDPCPPQTGAGGTSLEASLNSVKCVGATQACIDAGKAYWITVYSNVSGSGDNAEYTHVAWVSVLLRGFSTPYTGSPKEKKKDYFDFEFVDPPLTSGVIGVPTTTTIGPRGTQLCGTNYGSTIDRNCAFASTP